MKTNESTNACPKCGAPVPPEAPQGLCPQCVFAQAAAPEAAPTATSQIPSLERLAVAFPQLQILELIGRGGMGFVFKARQPHLDRFVALKLLPDSLAHDAHFAERFNREGRTLARLNHPNIVSIFDFGQAGGFYFLLMEYVDGVNLRQAMQAGRFSPSEALTIVPKICEALQFAHEEGILHRDIKPENILLDSKGRVKIADFGIAKIVGEDKPDVSLTATGAALGTPHYMAPEQFEKPATVDHRADIYSLGVVFYEMLTGELPIGRFSPPSQCTPVDPRVDDVVMRTLEKEREKRFQSADEMRTNVEHLTESGAGNFRAAPVTPRGETAQATHGTIVIGNASLVKRPAQALLATGILNWVGSVFVVAFLAYTALGESWVLSPSQLVAVGALILLSSTAIIFGALKMMKVEAYPLAIAASVLAMITTPGSIIGLPIGLWALFTLRRPEVRAAFKSQVPSPSFGALKWALLALLVCGLGVMLGPLLSASKSKRSGAAPGLPLPEGMVELVAVSQHPTDGNWWRPDGTSFSDGQFENSGATAQAGPGQRAVQFVFRAQELERVNSSRTYKIEGASGWAGGVPPRLNGRPMSGGSFVAATFPDSLQTTTIRVGVAIDAWETVASATGIASVSHSFSRNRQPRKVSFHDAIEDKSGDTILFLTHNLNDENTRVVAIDANGREHANVAYRTSGERVTLTFAKVSRDQIREFRFQARPYRWAEFKDVQLTPLGETSLRSPLSAPAMATNETPWIRFTFTAVELREVKGVRWLAIDYVDDVHGECQKSFPWETTIPGFKAETRTTEFVTDAKGGSPSVRHQRVEYRMPDSSPRDQLERLRDELEKKLQRKSFRLELGENQVPLTLFELPGVEGGSLKARIKVMPPLKLGGPNDSLEYRQAVANQESLLTKELSLLEKFTPEHPAVKDVRAKIEIAREKLKRLEQAASNNPADTAEIRLRLAREEFDAARKKAAAGQLRLYDLAEAERRFAIAEARGDAVAAARMNLKFAEASLTETKRRVEVGIQSPLDLKFAESRLALAEKDLQEALKTNSVPAKNVQTESTPLQANIPQANLWEYRVTCRLLEAARERELKLLSEGATDENPLVVRVREQIKQADERKKAMEAKFPKLAAMLPELSKELTQAVTQVRFPARKQLLVRTTIWNRGVAEPGPQLTIDNSPDATSAQPVTLGSRLGWLFEAEPNPDNKRPEFLVNVLLQRGTEQSSGSTKVTMPSVSRDEAFALMDTSPRELSLASGSSTNVWLWQFWPTLPLTNAPIESTKKILDQMVTNRASLQVQQAQPRPLSEIAWGIQAELFVRELPVKRDNEP